MSTLSRRAWNGFQLCEGFLDLFSNLFRDFSAPRHTIVPDVLAYSVPRGKITLRDFPALGTAELLPEPLRHPVPGIHGPVEFVDLFVEGIPAECHPGEQSDDPGRAVLDFADPQAHSHDAGGKGAARHAHE